MSKKTIIGICAFAMMFGLAGIGYTILSQKSSKFVGEPILKPWIEVVAPSVFVSNEDGSLKRELKTGDEVEAGAFVDVAKGGEANIYFPDGSVARLDAGSKILMDAASYDPKSKTLVVKVQLLIGRMWSKIFTLATPESTWEVKTSNAVATVRGTSFLSEVVGNKSSFAGGTGVISVSAIVDSVVVGAPTRVVGGQMAKLTNVDAQQIADGILSTISVTEQDKTTKTGVAAYLEEDARLETTQEKIQNPNEFRREVIRDQPSQPLVPQENSTTTPSEIFSEFKELRIVYNNDVPNKEIPVDSSISFKAFLVKNDLSERDVTNEAEWLVRTAQNVSIGTITKQGVFTAKLDEDSSEQPGFGEGFITVSWKDPSTGSIFRAQTQILKVFIPESPIPEDI